MSSGTDSEGSRAALNKKCQTGVVGFPPTGTGLTMALKIRLSLVNLLWLTNA